MSKEQRTTTAAKAPRWHLRQKGTRQFLAPDGWTPDVDKAEAFPSVFALLRTFTERRLQDVEIALRLGGKSDRFLTRDLELNRL